MLMRLPEQSGISSAYPNNSRTLRSRRAQPATGRNPYRSYSCTLTYGLSVRSPTPSNHLPITFPSSHAASQHTNVRSRSSVTDYFPKWRVPKTRKALDYVLTACLFLVGWGWYEFETNDVGLTEGIRRVWTAKPGTLQTDEPKVGGLTLGYDGQKVVGRA